MSINEIFQIKVLWRKNTNGTANHQTKKKQKKALEELRTLGGKIISEHQ
jgi:hypothetical protein